MSTYICAEITIRGDDGKILAYKQLANPLSIKKWYETERANTIKFLETHINIDKREDIPTQSELLWECKEKTRGAIDDLKELTTNIVGLYCLAVLSEHEKETDKEQMSQKA